MTLFRFLWLRRLVRSRTRPIAQQTATKWKTRLSVLYALLAWNAFGVVIYAIANGKGDWAKYYGYKSEEEANMRPAQFYANKLGIKNATVIRVSGTEVTRYDIQQDKPQNN